MLAAAGEDERNAALSQKLLKCDADMNYFHSTEAESSLLSFFVLLSHGNGIK